MADNVMRTDARHLLRVGEFLDKPLLHGYVLSNDKKRQVFDNMVISVNVECFLG